jgi:hypothetical protein
MDELTGFNQNSTHQNSAHQNSFDTDAANAHKQQAQSTSGQSQHDRTRDRTVSYESLTPQAIAFKEDILDLQQKERRVHVDASHKKGKQQEQGRFRRSLRKFVSKVKGTRSIEILNVFNTCQDHPEQFQWGWIDPPKKGEEFTGYQFLVAGWVVGQKAQPQSIQFFSDNVLITETPVNIPRPDVIKHHFYHPDFTNCGYSILLDLEQVSDEADLVLQAIFPNGEAALFGSIQFCKY